MGEKVTRENLTFVSFAPNEEGFVALLPMEALFSSEDDTELVLRKAVDIYERWMIQMRHKVAQIEAERTAHKLVPARKVWELGDDIFQLKRDLAKLRLQIDRLYDHLERDLGVKRKRLEKFVIWRRYLPNQHVIPESLNWGRCEKGTRRVAERLHKGLLPS